MSEDWAGHSSTWMYIVVRKPLGCKSGGVFGIIVLLEVLFMLFQIQLFKAFNHSIIKNFTILLCIHLSLNFYELSHPIPTHTTPYHQVVSPSTLDSWGCGSVWHWFPLLFPDIHFAIRPNVIDLGLIWPQHCLLVLYSPIFVILSKFKPPLTMGLLEHRSFLLCTGVKSTLLQHISDCLRMNRVEDDRINELGGLNCIIKPSRFDLTENGLLVMNRQLGRMTSRIVLPVPIPLLLILPTVPFPRPVLAWIWQWENWQQNVEQ